MNDTENYHFYKPYLTDQEPGVVDGNARKRETFYQAGFCAPSVRDCVAGFFPVLGGGGFEKQRTAFFFIVWIAVYRHRSVFGIRGLYPKAPVKRQDILRNHKPKNHDQTGKSHCDVRCMGSSSHEHPDP